MEHAPYRDQSVVKAIVDRFECGDFKIEEFTHALHVTVAAWYLCEVTADEGLVRMRAGLRRFIEHHGKQGYHETITRFWMELIGSCLSQMPGETSITRRVNQVVERYGSKEVLFEYYTREHVMSDLAKKEWVEPDLKAIQHGRYTEGVQAEETRRAPCPSMVQVLTGWLQAPWRRRHRKR